MMFNQYTTKNMKFVLNAFFFFQHKYLGVLKLKHIYWRSKMTEDIKSCSLGGKSPN